MRAGIALVNYQANPSFENGNATGMGGINGNAVPNTISYPSDGGMFGTRYLRKAYTGNGLQTQAGPYSNILPSTDFAAGDVVTVSYYFRPSKTVTARASIEQPGSSIINGTGVSCPPNVWTRVSATITVTGSAGIRPIFYFPSETIVSGDTFDWDGLMVTKTNYLTDYRDGTFPGWSWSGSTNTSASTGPYFVDKPMKVRGFVNYMKRPYLVGSGSVPAGWVQYNGSGTPTGTRTLSGGVQTITATGIIGGNRRFGIGNISPDHANGFYAEAGEMLYLACDIDTSAMDAGTRFGIYMEPRSLLSGNVLASPEATLSPGATRAELRWTVPAGEVVSSTTVYAWLKSATGTDWTGTSTVLVSNFLLTKIPAYDAGFTYPYFDGNTTDAVWRGTAYQSASILGVWRDAKIKTYNGTAWVTNT